MHIYTYISFNLTLAFQPDATRRPSQRRKDVHRIPPKFFDDSSHHPQVRSSVSHHNFSHFCAICISRLEQTTYPHPPPANIISLYIHLHIDAHTLTAFSRYSNAATTIHTMRHPDLVFSSGPVARSFTCHVDGMMKESSCRSVALR